MIEYGHFVGGKQIPGKSGRTSEVFQPMDGTVRAHVALASKEEVRAAVENALAEHPDVADNAVIGVTDERFGHRLAAYVVPRSGSELDEEGLREYLQGKVSRFEQPRDIHFLPSLPRNPAGKVLRKELPD